MFGSCFKRLQLVVARRYSIAAGVDSVNHFHCFQKGPLFCTSFSSKSLLLGGGGGGQKHEKDVSFTVSYLVSKCGLSPEEALSVCKKHRDCFNSPAKPDSVIKLLKHYGLSDAHISQIAKRRLQLLTTDAEKTLLPKLEFLSSIDGISGTSFARMLCSVSNVLSSSLEKSLKPCYDISTTLPIPKEKLPSFFIVCFRILKAEELRNVAHNVSILREHGVPESSLILWFSNYLKALSFESEKVKENVNKVISMGFSPKSPRFMNALYVISVTDGSRWEQRIEFYKKWGWTEDDVMLAFRKSPMFMSFSEKNISIKLDLILNKMGYQPVDVIRCPLVLNHSLEKWIIPRCSVIRVLLLKGLIMKEKFSFCCTALVGNKKRFLDKFVIKYQEQVPELLSIFEGKIGLEKLGLGFEEDA